MPTEPKPLIVISYAHEDEPERPAAATVASGQHLARIRRVQHFMS
jgi:hypothetical protein